MPLDVCDLLNPSTSSSRREGEPSHSQPQLPHSPPAPPPPRPPPAPPPAPPPPPTSPPLALPPLPPLRPPPHQIAHEGRYRSSSTPGRGIPHEKLHNVHSPASSTQEADAANTLASLFRVRSDSHGSNSSSGGGGSAAAAGGGSDDGPPVAPHSRHFHAPAASSPAAPSPGLSSSGVSQRAGTLNLDCNSNPDNAGRVGSAVGGETHGIGTGVYYTYAPAPLSRAANTSSLHPPHPAALSQTAAAAAANSDAGLAAAHSAPRVVPLPLSAPSLGTQLSAPLAPPPLPPPPPIQKPPPKLLPAMSSASSRSISPAIPSYNQQPQSPTPSPAPSSPGHHPSSSASSSIQVVRPAINPPSRSRSARSRPDYDVTDSDRTESDRPPSDSEETEEEEFPFIPPRQASTSVTPAPQAAAPVVGVGGQRGVAKAVKKGSRKAPAKRNQSEGGTPKEGAAGPKKKAGKPGRKKGGAVAKATGGAKKRRKVDAEEMDEDEKNDDLAVDTYPTRSPSPPADASPKNIQNGTTPNGHTPNHPGTPSSSSSAFPPGPYDPSLPLYCICRRPDSGKWMIACDGCDDWFHGDCIAIPETDGDLIESYFCPTCTSLGRGATSWKRKCRLAGCRKPAAVGGAGGGKSGAGGGWGGDTPSKYCSQDHGITFFEQQIARSRLTKAVLASVVAGAEEAAEFHALGERIPTPPLEDGMEDLQIDGGNGGDERVSVSGEEKRKLQLARPYPEIYNRLKEIGEQVSQLEKRVKPLLQLRARYIEYCWARRARVIEGLREEAFRAGDSAAGGEAEDGSTAGGAGGAVKKGAKGGKKGGGGKAANGGGGKGGVARWEICGYDARLGWGDEELLRWVEERDATTPAIVTTTTTTTTTTAEAGAGEYDHLDLVDFSKLDEADPPAPLLLPLDGAPPGSAYICTKKKCAKHQGWQKVRFEEVRLEERLWGEKVAMLREEEGRCWEGLKRRVWRDRERGEREREGGRKARGAGGGGIEGPGGGGGGEGEGGWVVEEGGR